MSKPGAYPKFGGNGAWWRDPQDYSGFALKPQNINSEIGTTRLARPRVRNAAQLLSPQQYGAEGAGVAMRPVGTTGSRIGDV